MAGSSSKERSLEATPTWAVAVVCFVLVAISFLLEYLLHLTGSWLKKKRKASLFESLQKVKAELMLVGFISLLLTICQDTLAEICVPRSVGHSWHPCKQDSSSDKKYEDPCQSKGKVQLISAYGIHQLHIFIFTLAVTHVLYSVVTLGLGRLKMRKWKSWEDETKTIQYQYYNDPERFRFARDTSFGRRHMHYWSKSPFLLWIVCFFRQFFTSVAKVDYLTLRHGFITAHLTPLSQASFNFQNYINRSLEEDFKVVVGISPVIWLSAVLLLLTNTNGWSSHFWIPFIPLIMILLIGAKLQVIITKMGIRILERGVVVKGTPVVQIGDDLFWFNRPGLILFLIHFVSFQNAFQLAFFGWSWYEFQYPSCYHKGPDDVVIRIVMGVLVQVICSYVTLPLYALVTQMGSTMRPTIFSDQVVAALRVWHQGAKRHMKQGRQSGATTPFSSRPATPLHGAMSPVHLLLGHPHNSDNIEYGIQISRRPSNLSNDGLGVSPHHHDLDIYSINDGNNVSEIEREIENPGSSNGEQQNLQIVLNDFSFRSKQNIGEITDSKRGLG